MKDKVFEYLKLTPFEGKTPTQIGLALGYPYNSASSSITHALKSLMKEDKIKRYKDNSKVKYRINLNA